jgi:iron complex outermembrane receptor protein
MSASPIRIRIDDPPIWSYQIVKRQTKMGPRMEMEGIMIGLDGKVARREALLCAVSLLAWLPATAIAQDMAQPAEASDAAADADQSGDIVVTARRREENLQQVPVSVAAMTADQLESRSIESVSDLSRSTPNFTFSEMPQSGRIGGLIFIRGVGQRDSGASYDPAVGTYVDGVYLGRMYGNNLDLLEVERVEVLRGPQGTLFGKNTSGGAISIVTKRPDPSGVDGRVQVATGSRKRVDLLGSVNLPLIDGVAALRVAGAYNVQDGYGRRIDGQEMADTNRQAARVQLLVKPSESFSALFSFDYLHFDERNASFKLVQINTASPPVAAYNGLRDPDYDARWLSDDYRYNGTGPNSSRGTIWGASLTLDYDLGGVALKSITAYRKIKVFNDLDPDGSPITILHQYQNMPQDQFSQELQLSGDGLGGRLDYVLGAFYFKETAEDNPRYNVLTPLFGGARDFGRTALIKGESLAFFGQGNFSITDRLRLTAGLRYTDDKKRVTVSRTGFGPFGPLTGNHGSTAWSPRVGLDYRWTDDIMTYVSVAQGSRNGGFNGRPGVPADFLEFRDETVWTYEAGLRSQFLDGAVQFNATGYYSDFKDLQLQIQGSTVVGNPPSAQPFALITNIPKSTIHGGEFELNLRPLRGLVLNASLGLTYARYKVLPTDPRFLAFVATGQLSRDTPFPYTPEVSFSLGAEYRHDLANGDEITGRVDYTHQSRTDYAGLGLSPNAQQPAFGLLNARLTYETDSGLALSVFGTNLANKAYITGATDDAPKPGAGLGFSIVSQGRPREFGVSLTKRF